MNICLNVWEIEDENALEFVCVVQKRIGSFVQKVP